MSSLLLILHFNLELTTELMNFLINILAYYLHQGCISCLIHGEYCECRH